MALQFVGSTSATGTGSSYNISLSGTLTGGIASSPATGDIVIVVSAAGGTSNSAPTVTGNSFGAYSVLRTAYANDTWDTNLTACFAVMGGTPDTQITATRVSSASYGGGTIVTVWRGQNAIAFNQIYSAVTITNSCYAVPANATPSSTDTQIIVVGAGMQTTSGSAFTVPAALTGGSVSIKGDGSTSDIGVYAGWVAGTQNSTTVINAPTGGTTSTSSSGAAVTLVITSSSPPVRYWVGGTGTWNTTNTAVWSTSSGGAGGASVPGPGDNIVFDTAGTYTVTCSGILNCNDFTVSGGNYTFTDGGPEFNIYGSLTLPVGTTWSSAGQINFRNNYPGVATISSSPTLGSVVILAGINSTCQLASALSCGAFFVTTGTFDTANYALTVVRIVADGLNPTINLGSSSVLISSVAAIDFSSNSLTLNAGTSTITLSYTGSLNIIFSTSKVHTFHNITLSQWGSSSYVELFNLGAVASGTTFNNLLFSAQRLGENRITLLGRTYNFTGSVNFGSTSPQGYRRLMIIGGQWTNGVDVITRQIGTLSMTSGQPTLYDVDFFNITATGTGTLPWTGTRLGDGLGNSNITFPAPKTVYYYSGISPTYWNASGSYGWGTGSGGSGVSGNNFPLLQDTAVIDNNSFASGTTLLPGWDYPVGTLDIGSRTLPMTLDINNDYILVAGNVYIGSAVTGTSTTGILTFCQMAGGVNRFYFTPASWSVPTQIVCGMSDGTQLGGAALIQNSNLDATQFGLSIGNLDLTDSGAGNYALTTRSFAYSGSVNRSITFGTGKIVLTGTGSAASLYGNTITNLTISGSKLIELDNLTGTATINNGAGAGGTESNAINLNVLNGTAALTFSGHFSDINCTGFSGSLAMGGITVYGDITLSSSQTLGASTSTVLLRGTSGTQDITTNGKTLDFPININGVGGTVRPLGTTTMGSSRLLTLTNGTLNLNGQTFSAGTFVTAAGTKNITFNGGTLRVLGSGATAWNNSNPTGFTTTAGTGSGSISMNSASAKTFVGGGSTYNCTLNQGGAGALTINSSSTFTDITTTVRPVTITFTAGTTQTVSNFSLSGIAGSLVTINSSTAGSRATISKSSGTVSVSYCSIQDSNATGGATWNSYLSNGNLDAGNNAGWIFSLSTGNFLVFFS